MEVHKKLGAGFLESVYSEALEIELKISNIPFEREKSLRIYYEGLPMKKFFKADFYCYDAIIVELKSSGFITKQDMRQSLNYLKATQSRLGLLVNFGSISLSYKRILN